MKVTTEFPKEIFEQRDVRIPLTDGSELSARIWRPTSKEPVPAIVEYIPYRQRDLTAVRDSIHHPYIAGHGYACVRVDLRGSGDSDGALVDEYLEQEQQDAEDVLEWVAHQPWYTGRTGMMGISWGGFAALQVAARRPESLGAIVISSFTDDRYGDDFHYKGGCLLSDNVGENGTVFAVSTRPPDPEVVGERWREMWLERLDGAKPWVSEWLSHQHRDDYWRHASVSEQYEDVRCPVLASSGWADGYSNAVLRLLAHLDVPRKGIIGPWAHTYPHLGTPAPAIGYLQLVVQWWDRWLKDVDNDVMAGPMLSLWAQDAIEPATAYDVRPGRWIGELTWPSPRTRDTDFPLAPHVLREPGSTPPRGDLTIQSPLWVGAAAGKWASYGAPPDLPGDQRLEDGGALVFDTEELTEAIDVVGFPTLHLQVEADEPIAMVVARLSAVAPDGSATRVSYGMLNLTHRDGSVDPTPLTPGRTYEVRVGLNALAERFLPGYRIRLALSTSYWPLAWPPPRPVRLTVSTANSFLTLPIRPEREKEPGISFGEPAGAAPMRTESLRTPENRWTVTRDVGSDTHEVTIVKGNGAERFPDITLDAAHRAVERYTWTGNDVASVRAQTTWTEVFERGDWSARTVTHTDVSCTESNFLLRAHLEAFDGEELLRRYEWQEEIPRRLV